MKRFLCRFGIHEYIVTEDFRYCPHCGRTELAIRVPKQWVAPAIV